MSIRAPAGTMTISTVEYGKSSVPKATISATVADQSGSSPRRLPIRYRNAGTSAAKIPHVKTVQR